MLSATDLTIHVSEQLLLERASLQVADGESVAVVGRNGVGKSTLLSVLAGQPRPELTVGGEVRTTGQTIYLPQEGADLASLDLLGLEFVISARNLDVLEAELELARRTMELDPRKESISAFLEIEERYRALGGYTIEADVSRLCTGLGLDEDILLMSVRSLSGGQRRTLALVRVLYSGAENLILDEPTNHLDAAGKRRLNEELLTLPQAILVVSHDLALLDANIDRVAELRDARLTSFRGNYSHYRAVLAERIANAERRASTEEREIKRLRDRADSMRGRSARLARVAKSMDRRVSRIEENRTEQIKEEKATAFRMPPSSRGNATPVEVQDLSVEYVPGEPLFTGLSFAIARGDRLVVLGANGSGKTTLLKCIAGEMAPSRGRVIVGPETSIGYFAQQHETLDPELSALEHLSSELIASPGGARRLLGSFGLSADKALRPVKDLSGGERTKAALARLVAEKHSLLLLDEPTNNLDAPASRRLGELVGHWNGTLVVVSHDRPFVRRLKPTHHLMLPDQQVKYWRPEDLRMVSV